MQEDWGMHQSKLKKCKETLSGNPLRLIEGVEPDAMKVASPVLNGEREETEEGPRLALTQLLRSGYFQRLTPSVLAPR